MSPVTVMNGSSGDESLRRCLQAAVGSQYEIIRLLGRGGMGAVYLARDNLERLVAIKVILPHAFGIAGARDRFRQEMRTVARFAHPNIVPIYASGELDELDWFAMMYVSGDTVAARLRQEERIPPEEVRRILVELADALHYAHGLGVIHRDVKPANVMIDDVSGRAYLTDFGVAKTMTGEQSASLDTMAGTLGYMPPEAFKTGRVDHRADIYALGVLGYEMLAGRRPFVGENAIQTIVQTVDGAPPPLGPLVNDLPPDLEAVVMRCLAKDPVARGRDARHIRNAFGVRETDETTMPADLINMAGFGSWTLLWIAVWGTFAARALDRGILGIALAVVALIVPAGFVLQVLGMRPAKLPAMQIARVAFWPPKWWGMWWPRRLRRPIDLWRWLPFRAQLARGVLSAFLIVVPALILVASESDWLTSHGSTSLYISWFIAAMAVAVLAVLGDGIAWSHREQLDPRQTIRMLIGPTIVSPLWDTPPMSRLLSLHRADLPMDDRRQPANPRACLEAIKRLTPALTGPSRAAGPLAIQAARDILTEIDILDLEILGLADQSNAGLVSRIEEELAQLARSTRPAAATRREELMRQRDAIQDAARRLDLVTAERTRLFDRQCELWRELSKLSRAEPDERAAVRGRARLRRLCLGLDAPDDADVEREAEPAVAIPALPVQRPSEPARLR